MFAKTTIPELARASRYRDLTPQEIDEIYGADGGDKTKKPGQCAPTETCGSNGCHTDGDDSAWC